MKKLIPILLFIFTTSAIAGTYYMMLRWYWPTERENGDLIKKGELSHTNIFHADCKTGVVGEFYKKVNHPSTLKLVYWNEPIKCFKLTAVDTDGRESLYSELFKVNDYKSPKPIECGL